MPIMQSISIGDRFHRLIVINKEIPPYRRDSRYRCLCDCGNEIVVLGFNLKRGNTKSCGCLKVENARLMGKSMKTHGQSGSDEYVAWRGMLGRCYIKTNASYKSYGGRGIAVCPEWIDSFEQFFSDMGPRPNSKMSLERINNDIGYSPDNCKWATSKEQSVNKRWSKKIEIDGKLFSVLEFSKKFGVNEHTVRSRLRYGWPEFKLAKKVFNGHK